MPPHIPPSDSKEVPLTLNQGAVQLAISALLMHGLATSGSNMLGNELLVTEVAENLMRDCGMWAEDEDDEEPEG